MIPTPFGFLEVETEEFPANAAPLDEAELGAAPKALDPVNVIFPAGELIFRVMNAMVFVTAQDETVVSLPVTINLDLQTKGNFGVRAESNADGCV